MSTIETIAAAHPKVGVLLSPDAQALRGQLGAFGFSVCDASEPGIHWLVTDGDAPAAGVPVLRLPTKISMFKLERAILALFAGRDR
ncbi:MAG: hypothetical protein NVV74_12670 [Magnetospirillum sp.]|nr:hypothetical protein [Magnetospirillum sp.]